MTATLSYDEFMLKNSDYAPLIQRNLKLRRQLDSQIEILRTENKEIMETDQEISQDLKIQIRQNQDRILALSREKISLMYSVEEHALSMISKINNQMADIKSSSQQSVVPEVPSQFTRIKQVNEIDKVLELTYSKFKTDEQEVNKSDVESSEHQSSSIAKSIDDEEQTRSRSVTPSKSSGKGSVKKRKAKSINYWKQTKKKKIKKK